MSDGDRPCRYIILQAANAQLQKQLQAKCNECSKLYKQLEGQTRVINTVEEEMHAVRIQFTDVGKAVACNESRGNIAGLLAHILSVS